MLIRVTIAEGNLIEDQERQGQQSGRQKLSLGKWSLASKHHHASIKLLTKTSAWQTLCLTEDPWGLTPSTIYSVDSIFDCKWKIYKRPGRESGWMAASPSRRIPSRCLQIRACVWQFPLTEFSHKWVPGVGIPASLKTLFCRQTRTREKECAAGCAHEFIQSTRYLEIWLRSGSILGTSLAARTNLEDLQENPMHPPGFCHSWLGSSS